MALGAVRWMAAVVLGAGLIASAQLARAQEEAAPAPQQTGPRLDFPAGLATDGIAVYANNSRNNTIVKIDIASHSISALAGKLFQTGSSDGTGDSALFSSPDGLVLIENMLYLCDAENSDIRKVNLGTRAVTTVAGTANIAGTEDGAGAAAHFNLPTQLASDGSKFIYVADTGNSTIRRIALTDFIVTTIGGQPQTEGHDDGPAKKSTFTRPRGVATDGKNLYIADTASQLIRKIDLSTMTTSTIAGQAGVEGMDNGVGDKATFNNPEALATDGTNLYVADADNHAIRKIVLADATVSMITQVNGHIGSGLTISKDGSTLYFSDTTENAVQTLTVANGNVAPLFPLASSSSSNP